MPDLQNVFSALEPGERRGASVEPDDYHHGVYDRSCSKPRNANRSADWLRGWDDADEWEKGHG